MPRPGVTADYLAAITSQQIRVALFVEANFISGPIYVWSGLGAIPWNGHTWLGLGSLANVSLIEEGSRIEAKGVNLTLSGIDSTLLADIMTEFQVGLPVYVRLALFDAAGALIPDPVMSWAGRMDQPTLDVDGPSATITIACENRLVEMDVAVDRRYTNEDQQIDYPGDRGFEFVNSIQEVQIAWGRTPSSSNNV